METEASPKEVKKVLEGCINFLSIEVMAVDIPSSVLMSLEEHVQKMRGLVVKLDKMETFTKEKSPFTVRRSRVSSASMNMELKAASLKVSEFLKSSSGNLKATLSKVSAKIQNTSGDIKENDDDDSVDTFPPKPPPQIELTTTGEEAEGDDIYDDLDPSTYKRNPNVLEEKTGDEASISSNETMKRDDEDKMKTSMSCSAEEMKTKAVLYGTIRKHKQSMLAFKWSKRFCAIYESMLVYYKSESEQTPIGRIHLPSYNLVIPPNDRGFIFHLEAKDKKNPTYLFQADKLEDSEKWKKHLAIFVNKAASSGAIDNVSHNTEGSSGSDVSGPTADCSLTYDDVDTEQLFTAQQIQSQLTPATEETNVQENCDLVYDDVDGTAQQQINNQQTVVQCKDEQTNSPLHNRPPMPPPTETPTPIIAPRPTGPKPPTVAPPTASTDTNFSMDNIYMGLHDCDAEDERDLSFKRGQILYIIEKIDVNWWIAFLQGKVGLVPSNHLTTAFVN